MEKIKTIFITLTTDETFTLINARSLLDEIVEEASEEPELTELKEYATNCSNLITQVLNNVD